MLTKRNLPMPTFADTVKKTSRFALAALIVCTANIAPAAFAANDPLVDVKVTVKFRLSDLDADNGAEKVYAKMTRKAKNSCRLDRDALDYLDQTVEECTADIVAQFVSDADLDKLTSYHRQKTANSDRVQVASATP